MPSEPSRIGGSPRRSWLVAALALVVASCNGGVIEAGFDPDSGPDGDADADVETCGAVVCEVGNECVSGVCVPIDPCRTMECPNPGETCVDGSCVSGEADEDGDGHPVRADCDDDDAEVYPGVTQPCTTGCGEGLSTCGDDGRWGECVHEEDPCQSPNAESACVDFVCTITSCASGWADCDGLFDSGCETQLGTMSDCSSCGDTCRGFTQCVDGGCRCDPDCSGAACGASDGCGGVCYSGHCPEGYECQGGECVCHPDCSGADCGEGDGCGGVCADGWCPTNEDCQGGECVCPEFHYGRNDAGDCVPSCGNLLGSLGLFNDGSGCCPSGCSPSVTTAGGPGATYDCNYCCESDPDGPTCL